MHNLTTSSQDEAPASDHWRVADARFARAYNRTGDLGRSALKRCIASAFEAARPATPMPARVEEVFPSGAVRVREQCLRPWYVLLLGAQVQSPAQVIAAMIPAIARRVGFVAVVRAGRRPAWPDAVLTALELCGVEQVYAAPRYELAACFESLHLEGEGSLVGLGVGNAGNLGELPAAVHHLSEPTGISILESVLPALDMDAVQTLHAGTEITTCASWSKDPSAIPDAVICQASDAPPSARLVLEPGRETAWEWPDLTDTHFFSARTLYIRG